MGMNVGEKRALESVVGDAWWEPEGLAGIPVRCDVTLREIFEWDLPEVGLPQSPIPWAIPQLLTSPAWQIAQAAAQYLCCCKPVPESDARAATALCCRRPFPF